MITDNQVEDIMRAIDEITDKQELRKYIRDKLQEAYESGSDDNEEQEF